MRRMREPGMIGLITAAMLLSSVSMATAACDQAQAGASLLRVQSTGAFAKREMMNGRIVYTWSAAYKQPNRLMTALLVSDAEACLSGQRVVVEFYMPNGDLFARSTPDSLRPITMK
ncbi:MAG TPA: hypothetical protein VKY65_21130 [Alphaproteobacteria bacterium]|nr:hypothetical protein [Alphaproteobacteria bacterium]